jgi:CII-binding regulator of phage lambda lysogenization HflD
MHEQLKAILEALHKDIHKINKHRTTQNSKLATSLASIETKYEIALNTIATLGQQVEYLVPIQG